MECFIRCCWLWDIGINFFTGYVNQDGGHVMDPGLVAWRYLRKQFIFDMAVVVTDWAEVLLDGIGGFGILKTYKLFRIVRLLKLTRARDVFEDLLQLMQTEMITVWLSLSKMLILLLLVSHFLACGWYGLGRLGQHLNRRSWLDAVNETTFEARYMTSFHAAISIFFGEHVVNVDSVLERLFISTCLGFTFALQIWFVSFVTTAMTRMEIINSQRSAKFASLDRFLTSRCIHRDLIFKIHRNLHHALEMDMMAATESSIELLPLLSPPLLELLHFEMHSVTFHVHPFFNELLIRSTPTMKRICHSAASDLAAPGKEIIFETFQPPDNPCMLFVRSGKLQYDRADGEVEEITSGTLLCEAVLWTSDWIHVGTLQALTDCSFMAIDAQSIQDIAGSLYINEFCSYAAEFVSQLNQDHTCLSDVVDVGHITSSAVVAFPDMQPVIAPRGRNTKRSQASVSSDFEEADETCVCGNVFMEDAVFCRRCGVKRPCKIQETENRLFEEPETQIAKANDWIRRRFSIQSQVSRAPIMPCSFDKSKKDNKNAIVPEAWRASHHEEVDEDEEEQEEDEEEKQES
eukprot:TRINITY_DN21530_c0_g1_i1.p1 TRINITY_DN21530_c0_g1~~TRINITY_DN21530_c0_g1_i1.p1  ORF type:complete len:574 (+),score=116.93 TRINITY_DN21530_c0_g1_i1:50-1771(+)